MSRLATIALLRPLLMGPLLLGPLLLGGLLLTACGGGGGSGAPVDEGEPETFTVEVTNPPPTPPPAPTPQNALTQSRAMWTAAGIQHYRYTLQREAFAPPALTDPVVVEVLNGVVVSRTYAATGQPAPGSYVTWWPSIDGLFDIVANAYANGDAHVVVQYHPTLGFPVFGDFDPNLGLADDEHRFFASDFQVLP